MTAFRRSGATALLLPNRRGDRIAVVYEQLRTSIIRGHFAPGTRIVETEVAARLGVSRTPVRAALQRLEAEGYVFATGASQSRMCVAPLTREDARELFSILGEVESLAARKAAVVAPENRLQLCMRLRAINDRLGATYVGPTPDLPRAFEIDRAFHDVVVAAGGGPRLASLHAAIKPQIERYARVYVSADVEELIRSAQEHEAIIQAIQEGKAEDAAAAMRLNWQCATERMARVIDSVGEQGTF